MGRFGKKTLIAVAVIVLGLMFAGPSDIRAQTASDDDENGVLNDSTGGDEEDFREEEAADAKQDEESLPPGDPTLEAPPDVEANPGEDDGN